MPYYKAAIILLFEIGFGIKFNIVGSISISELFLLFYVPLYVLPKVKWSKTADLKVITIAYAILLGFQILSEIIVGNDLSSALKGLAITVVSYLHFMFLVYYLIRHRTLILVLIISQIANSLIFGSIIEEQSAEDILQGEAAAYLKFYVAPLVTLIFLAVSLIYKYKNFAVLFSLLGAILIVLGARSCGGIALTAGLVTYMLEHRIFTYNKKVIVVSLFFVCLVGYSFYVYYVNRVLSGNITSGNSAQVFLCNNPYNPLELLIAGRSEVWVGWQAFMDKFWFGYGAWPYDTTGRYQRMMFVLHGELAAMTRNQLNFHYLIPSHSVLIGCGMMNGVFAFLSMGFIVFYFIRKGVLSLVRCENQYKLVLVYYVINLFWTAMFSPQSHFRQTMPVAFAIIFIMSISVYKARLAEIRKNLALRYAAFRSAKSRI